MQAFFGLCSNAAAFELIDDERLKFAHKIVDVTCAEWRWLIQFLWRILDRSEQVNPALRLLSKPEQMIELQSGPAIFAFDETHNPGDQRCRHQHQVAQAINNQFYLKYADITQQGPTRG